EGYAQEQSAAAGEAQRRRRRLVRTLAEDPPGSEEALRSAAAAAGWPLPRAIAGLVTAPAGATEDELDEAATRLARRLGAGAIGAEAGGRACVFLPDPDAPARRRQVEAALDGERAALGPTVDWPRAGV